MTSGPSTVDLVIPLFNEQANIPTLLERLNALESELPSEFCLRPLFVDDHSTDRSPELLRSACDMGHNRRYLRLSCNSGSHIAILAGLEHSDGDCAVFIAADLQDPPEIVADMLASWRNGSMVVWAVPQLREGLSWFDRFSSRTFYWLVKRLTVIDFPVLSADVALLDHTAVQALRASVGANVSLMTEIARLGFSQASVPYVKAERKFGSSKWTFEAKLKFALDTIVSLSYRPLRAMSYLGLTSSLVGFLYAAIIIVLHLVRQSPVEGWSSIMVVLLVLSGVQMLMIGILGEYIWRILEEAKRRPRYVLEDARGFTSGPALEAAEARESRGAEFV